MAGQRNLICGPILKTMLLFAVPMILGNLLQQVYNIADTLIVGRFVGADALAAVGSAYTLMTFLTSVIIGLCMGCGSVFSMYFGGRRMDDLKESMWVSFWLIGMAAAVIMGVAVCNVGHILHWLQVPDEIYDLMYDYVAVILCGIIFVFLYNYFAFVLRSIGNSMIPLIFLGAASVMNIGLDLWFVIGLGWGAKGAAAATVIAQAFSGLGIAVYTLAAVPAVRIQKTHMHFRKNTVGHMLQHSILTCAQQSFMNFGILMIQGLVNSFGTVIMAAFAAAVKIDTFAYMPSQEFGNAFSLFIAQNYGAGKDDRIKKGTMSAIKLVTVFSVCVSVFVYISAPYLMQIFVDGSETAIIKEGVRYLRIEGAFYWGIGWLFLLYGFYRAIAHPGMSVVLTVISLGTRVVLAYTLAPVPKFGAQAIWWAIPIGWLLADTVGFSRMYLKIFRSR